MEGGIYPPYRKPCSVTFGNNCFDHAKKSDYGINLYVNTTPVPNPDGSGPDVAPYERFAIDAGGICETYNCDPSEAPCGLWLGAGDYQYTLVNDQPTTVPLSWSHTDGDTVNFAVCQKTGFKNVAVNLQWNGCFGWLAHDPVGCLDTYCLTEIPDALGNEPGSDGYTPNYSITSYEAYQPDPDQTKYLTCATSASFTLLGCDHGDVTETTAGASGSRSVDAHSGIITGIINTTEDSYGSAAFYNDPSDPSEGIHWTQYQLYHVDGGAGFQASLPDDGTDPEPTQEDLPTTDYVSGMSTIMDSMAGAGVFCGGSLIIPSIGYDLVDYVTQWNIAAVAVAVAEGNYDKQPPLPPVTDPHNYSAGLGFTDETGATVSLTLSWSTSDTEFTWDYNYNATKTDDGQTFGDPLHSDITEQIFSGSFILSNAWTAADVYADANYLLGFWDLTDDHVYPWRTSGLLSVAPLMSRNQLGGSSPLGNNSPKVDDLRSPSYDADGNAPFSDGWTRTYDLMDWFDNRAYVFQFPPGEDQYTAAAIALVQIVDGAILGAPLDAGYQNFFCWQFTDWHGCLGDDGEGTVQFNWWPYGYGMYLEDYNSQVGGDLPETATQWTDNYFAIGTPPGAYIAYADPTLIGEHDNNGTAHASGFVAYKYAEILNRWPSQNFGRPAGPDKFLFDETRVYCAENLSGSGAGSTWAIVDWLGRTPADGTDFSGVWGGEVVGGFFEVASYSGGTLAFGSQVYDLPGGWTSESGDDAICFGKLRFDSCPALLGRQAITISGTTATFSRSQPQFALATATHTEQVDFYDASYTLLASNVTATRVDDSNFTTATAYPTAVWVTITGVKYYFDDQFPKGDYAALTWLFDYRTNHEVGRLAATLDCDGDVPTGPTSNFGYADFTATAGCMPSQPCNPAVVCFSPNGETWANGITYDFPETFVFDERYGSRWQGYVQQTMTDLFWQSPHLPCSALSVSLGADPGETVSGGDITWVMDNGTCE